METVTKTPAHLWVVGILSLLWGGFGATDYVMTKTENQAWLSQGPIPPDEMLAYMATYPWWAHVGWALGVWGTLAGAVLLLMRSRHAVLAFAVSLVGAIPSLGYGLLDTTAPEAMKGGMAAVMPIVIIVLTAGLLVYSRAMKKKGVLR